MKNTLLLLDVADLWKNAFIEFGPKYRFDFDKILRKARLSKSDKITSFAFVSAVAGKKQDSLLKKLAAANITAIVYENKIDMIEVFQKHIESCDAFMLGSGSPELIAYVEAANWHNKDTYIIACAEGLDKKLANEADDIILLNKNETVAL